ncbi:MAG: hypothetical protein QXL16_02365 [Candidatus Micrarchaeaceae archaeon]
MDGNKVDEDVEMSAAQKSHKANTYGDLIGLIMKKAGNKKEFKKYYEYSGNIVFEYYKKFGDLDEAIGYAMQVIKEAKTPYDIISHSLSIEEENDGSSFNVHEEHGKSRIMAMLLRDYKKRFGERKSEAYKVLVLQRWAKKVETTNEMAILMECVMRIRERFSDSWQYETHIIPLLLDKAYNASILAEMAIAITNLCIGLSKKLKDEYLGIMTAATVLEYANDPSPIKKYIKELVEEKRREIDSVNKELGLLKSSALGKLNITKAQVLNYKLKELQRDMEELLFSLDPKSST